MKFFNFGKGKKQPKSDHQPQPVGPGSLVGLEQPKVKDPALRDKVLELNSNGLEYYKTGKYDLAKAAFEEAIEIDPEFAEPYDHLSAVHGKLGNQDLWFRYTLKFIKYAHPDNPMRKLLTEDLNIMDLLDIPENHGSLCLKAIKLSEGGDHEGALKLFRQAVEMNPGYGPGWADMGACLLHLNRSAEAEVALLKGIELMPDEPPYWQNLTVAYLNQKKLGDAEKAISMCEQLGASRSQISRLAIKLNNESFQEMISKADSGDLDGAERRALSVEKVARAWVDHTELKPMHLCCSMYIQAQALAGKERGFEAMQKLEQAYRIASENNLEELKTHLGRMLHGS